MIPQKPTIVKSHSYIPVDFTKGLVNYLTISFYLSIDKNGEIWYNGYNQQRRRNV